MKKLIATIILIISMMSVFATDEKTTPQIQKAFRNKFTNASEVSYITGTNYSKVVFHYKGNWMTAYYNRSAELMGVTKNIRSTDLPFFLQQSLKEDYSGFWIIDLFEFSDNDGFRYYITLQNADKTVVLVSANGSSWQKK